MENIGSAKAIPLNLPVRINISKEMAAELGSYDATHLARLIRNTGGLTTVVPLGMPMITTCGWTTIGGDRLKEEEMPELKPSRKGHQRSHKSPTHSRKSKVRSQENRERVLEKVLEKDSLCQLESGYENMKGNQNEPLTMYDIAEKE